MSRQLTVNQHIHKWIENSGTKIYTIDRNDFYCGTYKARCSICGAVETLEFSHYSEDA